MDTVAVIIASYGDRQIWDKLAQRALASLALQMHPPNEVHRVHGDSLHGARNLGAWASRSDWLCFLDCDDELEPAYLHEMMQAVSERPGQNKLYFPRVRYISESLVDPNYAPPPQTLTIKPLRQGNFMVIGTLIQRKAFLEVNGFTDWPAYEDWELWGRCCIVTGAEPCHVPRAIYRAHRRRGSRNYSVHEASVLFNRILESLDLLAANLGRKF